MKIEEIESLLDISYRDRKNFKLKGLIPFIFIKTLLTKLVLKKRNKKSLIESLEVYLRRLNINPGFSYDSAFLKLSSDKKNSFIFYGDHRSFIEPILVFLTLPKSILEHAYHINPINGSSLKLMATDSFLLYSDDFLNYVYPVVLRDSTVQLSSYSKDFLKNRRKNRGVLSDLVIRESAKHISSSGNSFMIFPQGYGKEWKSGLVRILDGFMKNYSDKAGNVFLVPIASRKLNPDWRHLMFKAFLHLFKKDDLFVRYGEPVALSEVMKGWNGDISDIEIIKSQMQKKTLEIKNEYYDWTGGLVDLRWD